MICFTSFPDLLGEKVYKPTTFNEKPIHKKINSPRYLKKDNGYFKNVQRFCIFIISTDLYITINLQFTDQSGSMKAQILHPHSDFDIKTTWLAKIETFILFNIYIYIVWGGHIFALFAKKCAWNCIWPSHAEFGYVWKFKSIFGSVTIISKNKTKPNQKTFNACLFLK